MRLAQLLLWCVLLEDYGTDLGRAAISSDAVRQEASSSSAMNPSLSDVPSFSEPIGNVTAAISKEAILSCTIRRLGNYKVGWIRVKDQTILSLGQRTVTHSPRFLLTVENVKAKNQSWLRDEEEATWSLHIRQLREADRGCYMCQINAQPMLSQLGCVDVLVPPDILSSGTSEGEVSVLEDQNATLSCNASGRPAPRVLWRREKNNKILIPVDSPSGEKLELTKVDRKQMGAYLCIAKNEVPPAVSKRVYLRVNFPPSAKVPNQLLGSPLGTNVSLICVIEAYPKTINLWKRREQVIMSDGRYEIDERTDPDEEWKTTIELKIKRLEKTDLGEYTCTASSSMGTALATIRVYEIERVTVPTRSTSINWKKLNRGKSKLAVTTVNRVFQQLSTPSMQKSSTSRLTFGRQTTTSTTADPRVPLVKDKNAFQSNKDPQTRGVAAALIIADRICTICLAFSLALR